MGVRVEVRNARGRLKYAWPARLVAKEPHEIVLYGDWERPLMLPDGRTVPITNRSLEVYPLEKPYAVAALLHRTWELKEYYVRLIRPPRFDPATRTLTLELLGRDIAVRPDYDYEILAPGPAESALSPEDEERLREGLFEVLEQIERREGIFDPQRLRDWLTRVRRM